MLTQSGPGAQTGYALRTLDYSGQSITNRQVADAGVGIDAEAELLGNGE